MSGINSHPNNKSVIKEREIITSWIVNHYLLEQPGDANQPVFACRVQTFDLHRTYKPTNLPTDPTFPSVSLC